MVILLFGSKDEGLIIGQVLEIRAAFFLGKCSQGQGSYLPTRRSVDIIERIVFIPSPTGLHVC